MPSLKQLKNLEAQPSLFDEDAMSILDTVSNEDAYELDEPYTGQPEVDWYVPKRSWKQFFAERQGEKIEGGWDIPVFDQDLPKEIRLNAWTMITDVKEFLASHLAILTKYNGNKRFKPYLERLNELKKIIS